MHSDHSLTTLTGKNIRLESFSEAHRNDLYQAAQDEQM